MMNENATYGWDPERRVWMREEWDAQRGVGTWVDIDQEDLPEWLDTPGICKDCDAELEGTETLCSKCRATKHRLALVGGSDG